MHEQLADGRSIQLFNVIGYFNHKGFGIKVEFATMTS